MSDWISVRKTLSSLLHGDEVKNSMERSFSGHFDRVITNQLSARAERKRVGIVWLPSRNAPRAIEENYNNEGKERKKRGRGLMANNTPFRPLSKEAVFETGLSFFAREKKSESRKISDSS